MSGWGHERTSRHLPLMSVKRPRAEVVCEAFVNPFRACAGVCGGHVAACLTFTLRLAAVMLAHYRRTSPGMITINKGTAESGSFRIENGGILPKRNATEEKR